jgi:succinate dehydrogenase / fumarate reductase cytochrome b subunit
MPISKGNFMANVQRPLSPHLQIYRMPLTAMLSIFHRITGVALALGSLILMWWLVAAASGPDYYAHVQGWLGSWLGRIILLGFTFALFYHLCNGVRHLFWDMGRGFEVAVAERVGVIVIACAVILTVLAWALAYGMGG